MNQSEVLFIIFLREYCPLSLQLLPVFNYILAVHGPSPPLALSGCNIRGRRDPLDCIDKAYQDCSMTGFGGVLQVEGLKLRSTQVGNAMHLRGSATMSQIP